MAADKNNKKKKTNGAADRPVQQVTVPFSMGLLVKELSDKKGLKPKDLAPLLHMTVQSVRRMFNRRVLEPGLMLRLSEVLDKNLFAYYKPNVTPEPNPVEQELKEAKARLKDQEELENQIGIYRNRIMNLEGQIEALERMNKERGK